MRDSDDGDGDDDFSVKGNRAQRHASLYLNTGNFDHVAELDFAGFIAPRRKAILTATNLIPAMLSFVFRYQMLSIVQTFLADTILLGMFPNWQTCSLPPLQSHQQIKILILCFYDASYR